jgi:carbon storage regulator
MIPAHREPEAEHLLQVKVLKEGPVMLVLSRKIGEKVVIGDGIVVVVKRILGQRVTFGIEAPESVRIVRGELPRFETAPAEKLPRQPRLRTSLWPVQPR